MKSIKIVSALLLATVLFSCAPSAPKAKLVTDLDSLSYATGVARTDGLKPFLVQSKVDTVYMNEFIRGFLAGVNNNKPKDVAAVTGGQIGHMVTLRWLEDLNRQYFQNDSTKTLDMNNMLAGFMDGVKDEGKMSMIEAQAYVQAYVENARQKALLEQYGDNKEAGEAFLAENKDKEGVTTLESGVQYKIIKAGRGNVPENESARISVRQTGRLIDDTEFETPKDEKPTIMPVARAVKGLKEVLCLMPVGSIWEIYIPQELGYGTSERGKVKPFSTLIYNVELVGIEK